MGNSEDKKLIYQMEGKPSLAVALPLGLQHILAMFTGNLAPILIIASICGLAPEDKTIMLSSAMVVSGLTTLIQLYPIKLGKSYRIGANLPIVMGTSFAFVAVASIVATEIAPSMGLTDPRDIYALVLGCSIVGSMTEVLMGFFYKKLSNLFSPIVVGTTLIAIGLNLLSAGASYFNGGSAAAVDSAAFAANPDKYRFTGIFGSARNLGIAFFVFVLVLVLQKFGKGIVKNSALLIALAVGYIVAIPFGMVDFSAINAARIVAVPLPFHFGLKFSISGILNFALFYVISGLETIGNTGGITIAAFDREPYPEETSGAILADALGSTLANCCNAMPNTAFGQNAGIIAMTKIVNKWCIAVGAIFLAICGLFPKLAAIFQTIPDAVLGGAIISVFAMITLNGIKMIAKAGFSERNATIVGITFSFGIGLTAMNLAIDTFPQFLQPFLIAVQPLISSPAAVCCIVSILASILFPMSKDDKELAKSAMQED
jgi:NCS2 family nucleobase:cation symporter-2